MTLIGFDTSMAVTAACVIPPSGEPVRTPAAGPERLLGSPAHSAELLPTLARLLERGQTGWEDVTAIAVGVGPGTFTGLRIGVATARGLAQALRVPLHPVSSLEALAAGIADGTEAAPGTLLLPLIDAKRGQVFASLHRAGEPLGRDWGPLALLPEELEERIADAPEHPLAAGDWALESLARLEAAGAVVPAPESGLHAIDALHVCRLARDMEAVAPERVHPVYVRQPDAEIARSARESRRDDGAA
ncbi:MAG: tRNA (adenosine(37)-N6)-threonylcarbamoyltransferase complex dimerization subunit type 1 TsaB [Solirubrobacterales bacterium]